MRKLTRTEEVLCTLGTPNSYLHNKGVKLYFVVLKLYYVGSRGKGLSRGQQKLDFCATHYTHKIFLAPTISVILINLVNIVVTNHFALQ